MEVRTMETAVKHRVSGAYRTVRAVVWKDGGEIPPPPIRLASREGASHKKGLNDMNADSQPGFGR